MIWVIIVLSLKAENTHLRVGSRARACTVLVVTLLSIVSFGIIVDTKIIRTAGAVVLRRGHDGIAVNFWSIDTKRYFFDRIG